MDSNEVIIHIGLHKTASSYMQFSLFPRLNNTLYIYGAKGLIKQWNKQIHTQNDHLLISHECFSGLPWNDDWRFGVSNSHNWLDSFKENITAIQQYFPQAIIVVFFRKHGDLLLSLYKQYVHEGGVLKFSDFYGENKLLQPKDLLFQYRIDLLNKLFEKVYFLDFEAFKDTGDQYLELFFQNEFSLDFKSKKKYRDKKNRGVSGSKLEALRKVNRHFNQAPKTLKKILRRSGLSPRYVFQNRLGFWEVKESEALLRKRKKVNMSFSDDWEYFESVKYVHQVE